MYVTLMVPVNDDTDESDAVEPLASGFNLTDGSAEVTVPNVPIGCGYQLVRAYSIFSALL